MPLLRATTTIPYFSNLPDDVATNTLYFEYQGTDPLEGVCEDLTEHIGLFYAAAMDGNLMSSVITLNWTTTWYDMSQAEPRVPIVSVAYTQVGTVRGAASLPLEASIVLSFQGTPVSGTAQARRRGRIYLGPLSPSAMDDGSTTTFPQVTSTIRSRITDAAETHLMGNPVVGTLWSVWSPTSGLYTQVTNGWVDNEIDTQRRRGRASTARTTFPAP